MSIETFDQTTMAKERAVSFTAEEQQLIMEFYEDCKSIITKKGNTTILNKARDAAWESIAERINACSLSGIIRTGTQIKIKYKNIISSANRKKALSFNRGRPLMDRIERGTSSEMVGPSLSSACMKVTDNSILLTDPPLKDETVTEDETITASEIVENGEPDSSSRRPSSSPGDKQGEDVKTIYKIYLLQEIEARQQEMEYRKLKMRKLELEIKKMEKDT